MHKKTRKMKKQIEKTSVALPFATFKFNAPSFRWTHPARKTVRRNMSDLVNQLKQLVYYTYFRAVRHKKSFLLRKKKEI